MEHHSICNDRAELLQASAWMVAHPNRQSIAHQHTCDGCNKASGTLAAHAGPGRSFAALLKGLAC